MIRRALLPLVLAAVFAGCQDENPLNEAFTYTGIWTAAAPDGITLLLEFEEQGDVLSGNIYVEDAAGDLSDAIPIRHGTAQGEAVYFTYDFSGDTIDGIEVDTVYFHGSRLSTNLLELKQRACWAGTNCVDIPFQVVREPAGF